MIRAAALSYAIVFSLLTGLICSGVLFIAAAQKKVEVIHNTAERVLFDSYAAIQYGVHELAHNDSVQFLHLNGDSSTIEKTTWGAFTLVTSHTFHGNSSKTRAALVGVESDLAALYLPGNASSLKITGKTRIEGDAFVPSANVERAYVGGKNYEFDKLVFGEIRSAENFLPPLSDAWKNITASDFTSGLDKRPGIPRDSVFSFQNRTVCFENLSPVTLSGSLSGNLIIHSFDSIVVTADARLSNVILISPVVHFLAGFSGTVQVIAHEHIVCEKGVRLLYPSVLLLNETEMKNPLARRSITLAEDAMVLGGILVTTQQYDFRKVPFLSLAKNAVVAGLVYNVGETETFGNIAGSLYTQSLLARAGGGSYGNHLVDAVISRKELPEKFLYPAWLASQDSGRQKILKWL